jgi:hypothetical protein
MTFLILIAVIFGSCCAVAHVRAEKQGAYNLAAICLFTFALAAGFIAYQLPQMSETRWHLPAVIGLAAAMLLGMLTANDSKPAQQQPNSN